MSAAPGDIARYTTDGVLITSPSDPSISAAIKAQHVDARDTSDREIEMFFDDPAVGQSYLDERFVYASRINPAHKGVELEDALMMGTSIPLIPSVPCFSLVDEAHGLNTLTRTRAYAEDKGTDRFSLELLQ